MELAITNAQAISFAICRRLLPPFVGDDHVILHKPDREAIECMIETLGPLGPWPLLPRYDQDGAIEDGLPFWHWALPANREALIRTCQGGQDYDMVVGVDRYHIMNSVVGDSLEISDIWDYYPECRDKLEWCGVPSQESVYLVISCTRAKTGLLDSIKERLSNKGQPVSRAIMIAGELSFEGKLGQIAVDEGWKRTIEDIARGSLDPSTWPIARHS